MDAKRLTGVKASSLKYDLLTALSVAGLHLDARHQISVSRLLLLITARYNWRLDEFCVGQRDLAKMWNVTERTVKREIKFWLEHRLVICKRQGVRGRVGAYRLNYPEIYRLSAPYWQNVGPDFQERMTETNPVRDAKVVAVDFGQKAVSQDTPTPMSAKDPRTWRAACQRMQELHPEHYRNWIALLQFGSDDTQVLELRASNQFVAHYVQTHLLAILTEAVEATLGPRRRIAITVSP
ncbi:DnaA-like protein [Yoonia maricola]|uniref:DnaA-like protein n=1 Tax=Yoonia maricola TaxID=420999 RepID=A0A2M8W006_9RHOB|nr:DnaA N-terminal domain-containing protein [Yoonia maricola]PJI84255.1 DnaA-like protein [Yoonia maricola]